MNSFFARIAKSVSDAVGSPIAFVVALFVVLIWALTGPVFAYSERWQLVINTGTTIITFLMVFIIQSAQNRDQKALQLKLDELLRATEGAESGFVDLENMDDATLRELEARFKALHEEHAGHEIDQHQGETMRAVADES